jgi:YegS/Rv2252/BmrU family lipid kinase
MKRACVVVNPVAGGGRTRRIWGRVRAVLERAGIKLDVNETSAMGAGADLAARAARDGWPLVVAVGGDGTVNEVVNGVVEAAAPDTAVAVIPTGRGRDVCRNFGVARDPMLAARRVIEGDDVGVDVGLAESADGRRRYFLSAAGIGFDAAVAERARRGRAPGTIGYLLAVLRCLAGYQPSRVTLVLDDGPAVVVRVAAVVCANSAHYGGGMKIAPSASPSDGRFDVVVLGDLGSLELLRWLPTLYTGGHLRNPKVSLRPATRMTLETASPLPAHTDGEPLSFTPVRLAVRPNALRLRR